MTRTQLNELLRNAYIATLIDFFTANGDEVLRTASNEIAIPCVDKDGNGKFAVFSVKVPTGSRDGDEYDAYSVAESYALHLKQKAEEAKQKSDSKAKKIAKDKAEREAKAKAKAEAKAEA